MKKFSLLVLLLWGVKAHASYYTLCFKNADEKLSQVGVPTCLLPSRMLSDNKLLNVKNAETAEWGSKFNSSIPLLPGTIQYAQNYLGLFLLSVFPANERFLLANQKPVDPVSNLRPQKLGALVHVIRESPKGTHASDLFDKFSQVLRIPAKTKKGYEDFNRHDFLQGLVYFADAFGAEGEAVDPSSEYPISEMLMENSPELFVDFLQKGDFERVQRGEYKYLKDGKLVDALRKRRFAETLTQALVQTPDRRELLMEALAVFAHKKSKSPGDLSDFYNACLGKSCVSEELFTSCWDEGHFLELRKATSSDPASFYNLSLGEIKLLIQCEKRLRFMPLNYSNVVVSLNEATYCFADCVEPTLRDILMRVIFTPTAEPDLGTTFDARLLPEGPAKAYFSKFSTWDVLSSTEAQQAWAQNLVGKKDLGFIYVKKDLFELKSGLSNGFLVLRYLLGMPSYEFTVDFEKELEDLSAQLSNQDREVRLSFKEKPEPGSDFGAVELFIEGNKEATLEIENKHSQYQTCPSQNSQWAEQVILAAGESAHVPVGAHLLGAVQTFSRRLEFEMPATLEHLLSLARGLSPPEKLDFYYSLDGNNMDLGAAISKFIIENDLANFSYILNFSCVNDHSAYSKFYFIMAPVIRQERLSVTQLQQLMEAMPFLMNQRDRDGSLLDWALSNDKAWLLDWKGQNVEALTVCATQRSISRLIEALDNYPNLTFLSLSVAYKCLSQEQVGCLLRKIKSLEKLENLHFPGCTGLDCEALIESLPDGMDMLQLDVPVTSELDKKSLADRVKRFLRRFPEGRFYNQAALSQEMARSVLEELAQEKLPHRNFVVKTEEGGVEAIYKQVDAWAQALEKGAVA